MKFRDMNISDNLKDKIAQMGFEEPTMIQEKSIPHIINGKDIVGESATGSGKTLAFGCGIAQSVEKGAGLQALILEPTRELAEQVMNALSDLSKDLSVISIYGGVAINPQMEDLHYADVVVATPGRLLDHMQRETIDLSRVKILVLDEADRMLDMGFIEDVEKIISQCPKDRQTHFFSATILPQIQALADRYLHEPMLIKAERMVDPELLSQFYYDAPKNVKMSLLIHLLEHEDSSLVMVFCNTRHTVEFVTQNLKANSIEATAIHGGFTQNKRSHALESFNKGKMQVLVCTDVAARGLHIDSVSHVYNYEIPNDPTDYVHRIGRTARAGEEGKVINLLTDIDHDNFSRMMNTYDFQVDRIERPQLQRVKIIAPQRSGRFGGSRGGPRRGGFGPRRGGFSGNRGPRRSHGGPSHGGNRGPSHGGARRGPSHDGNRGPSHGGARHGPSHGGNRGPSHGGARHGPSHGGNRGPSHGGNRGPSQSGPRYNRPSNGGSRPNHSRSPSRGYSGSRR